MLKGLVTATNLVQDCDVVNDGALRMLTPFLYPDGSQIDLFLEEVEPLLETKILSDLGQTTSYLLDLQVKPWASNKRRQIIEDICRSLDVQWRGGRFQIELQESDMTMLSPYMIRLAQACIRGSDLSFSARIWSMGSFRDEIEEYLASIDVQFESNVSEEAKSGREVKVDFRVTGESSVSLLQSMSAGSASSAKHIANEMTVRWFDLGSPKKGAPQHLTVIDETNNVFKEDELRRLERLSTVFWFPAEEEQLTATLRA